MTRTAGAFAAGLGLGAGLMYFLDPDRGGRRRTHARNQIIHASHAVGDNARAQLVALQRAADDVDDRALAERIRAILGHVVTHAHAVALEVSKGVVTVSGPVLREEIRRTITALRRVPGVRRVVNALEARPAPQRISAMSHDARLAWARDRITARRVATALAGAASLALVARAAMSGRSDEFELRS
jgi:hypothetical protein